MSPAQSNTDKNTQKADMVLANGIKLFSLLSHAILLNSPKGASYLQKDCKHPEQREHPPHSWTHPYLRLWVSVIVRC